MADYLYDWLTDMYSLAFLHKPLTFDGDLEDFILANLEGIS